MHLYLLALGSNQRHHLLGSPASILRHAIEALEMNDIDVFSAAPISTSRPVGPSNREFANTAALVVSSLEPPEMLARIHAIETHFGRQRRGQAWRARTLDIDLILWSGGIWESSSPALAIPHPRFRERGFVLAPCCQIAAKMRDPLSGLTIEQLQFRFLQAKPLDRSAKPA
jgi:2-amino-4-hydroxy-6-hydroxymethyldihydropteridine diphosphokinase